MILLIYLPEQSGYDYADYVTAVKDVNNQCGEWLSRPIVAISGNC